MEARKEETIITKNVIEFSDEEMELLAALADFPDWEAQTDRVMEFCAALHYEVRELGFTGIAQEVFEDRTSI